MIDNQNLHPRNIEPFKKILAISQLKRLLHEDIDKNKETPFYFQRSSFQSQKKNSGLYCRFKGCKARLVYLLNPQKIYELTEFHNKHDHQFSNKIARFKMQQDVEAMGKLFCNDEMKTSIAKFSRCMYINLYTIKQNWNALVFSGVRHDQAICIFGLTIMQQIDDDVIKQVIEQISCIATITQTLIFTNSQISKIALPFFPHATPIIFEPFNCPRLKVRFNYSKLVSETTTELEWEADKRRLAMQLSEDLTITEIKNYSTKYKHVCLPFLPSTFVGLGVQLMHPLAIFHCLEEKAFLFNKIVPFYRVFPSVIKMQHIDPQAKNWIKNLQVLFRQDSLYKISSDIEETAFRYLIRQQNRSMYCNFEVQSDGSIDVKHDSWGKFKLTKNTHTNLFECQCGLPIKTGLPCCHILKVLLFNSNNIKQYIDPYWMPAAFKSKFLKKHQKIENSGTKRNKNRNQIKKEDYEMQSNYCRL